MKNPIVVALDLDDVKLAYKLTEELMPYVGGFKVGPRLTFRADKKFLKDISEQSLLFFDHKFFDIPSTTFSAVEVAAEMGAHWVTVHSLSGYECLTKLSELEQKIRVTTPHFRVLAVTVLTSFSKETLPPIWKTQDIKTSVVDLAKISLSLGIKSLVCSPEEISSLKPLDKEIFLVVPGIRPEGSVADDQRRTATPFSAIKAGASALVIGRPIIGDKNPVQAAKKILESLSTQ